LRTFLDVGQVFSVLFAGIATAGVAAALRVQTRQFKTSQAQGTRMMQIGRSSQT